MNTLANARPSVSVFAERILMSLGSNTLEATDCLSNVEILLVLSAAADSLTQPTHRSLARERLIAEMGSVCLTAERAGMSRFEYERAVDGFLEHLLTYTFSEELKDTISRAITQERREELTNAFLKRMADASNAGVLSSNAPILVQPALPQPHSNAFFVRRAPTLLVPVLAFALSNWILSGMATAQAYTRPQRQRDRIFAQTQTDSSQTTAAPSEATSQTVKVLLASLDSDNVEESASALDSLAGMGRSAESALPSLRRRMQSEEEIKRWEAAWVIGYISSGQREDVEALMRALHDRSGRVRQTAALALGLLGPAAHAALSSLDEEFRMNKTEEARLATDCIRGTGAACDDVKKQLHEQDPLLRWIMEQKLQSPSWKGMSVCMCAFLTGRRV